MSSGRQINLYRVWCTTDLVYKKTWAETAPTKCPDGHAIAPEMTAIIDQVDENQVIVKEGTGVSGFFMAETHKITVEPLSTGTTIVQYPMTINVLALEVIAEEEHRGCSINIKVADRKIIGNSTMTLAPATAWTATSFEPGDCVDYSSAVYTCTATTTNESPTDSAYWIRGYRVQASDSVIENVYVGFYIEIDDSVNQDDLGRILSIDATNNHLYMENGPANSYEAAASSLSPPFLRLTVYTIKHHEFAGPGRHDVGESKIGGSYVPADTPITITFDNPHTYTTSMVGRLEFLY